MLPDIVKPVDNFFSVPSVWMGNGDYKTEWVQARITELRGARRLTYAEIARRAGVSKQYLAQVPALSTYWSRHSITIAAAMKGVSARGLQGMLGHAKSSTTDAYGKSVFDQLGRETFRKLFG